MSRALKAVTGVKTVKVDYAKRQANLVVAKTACTQPSFEALSSALKKAGYGGSVVEVSKGK